MQICDEQEMQVSQLYTLTSKFDLKALSFIRGKGIFCGEALSHVNDTLQRLETTIQTIEKYNEKLEESEDTDEE